MNATALHTRRPEYVRKPEPIESQRVLCTKEVAAYLGVCTVTATKIMRESGKAFRVAHRVLITENNLRDYLKSLEGAL